MSVGYRDVFSFKKEKKIRFNHNYRSYTQALTVEEEKLASIGGFEIMTEPADESTNRRT